MTERDLYRRFYRAARVGEQTGIVDEALHQAITADAVSSGFSPVTALQFRAAALNSRINVMLRAREPSRQSVAIQTMVFTFGRVRRNP